MARARLAALLVPLVLVLAPGGAAAVAVPGPPTIGEKPDATTTSTTATFTFTSSEVSVFECSLDGAAFSTCTSPVVYTALGEGAHSFAVRGVDGEGVPGAPATHAWTIDAAAPTLVLLAPADGASTNDTTPNVTGTAGTAPGDEATVRVQVRAGSGGGGQPVAQLDAAVDPATGAWSVTVAPALAEGVYNVKADQRDAAGNNTETPRHFFTVDVTAPGAPTVTGPAARTKSTSAQIGFSHADGATFLCKLDTGAEAPCTSPTTYTNLADGFHQVAVRAVDAAGNVGPPATRGWTVDTTAPPVAITSPAAGTTTSDLTPAITGTAGTATGDVATVTVRLYAGTNTNGDWIRQGTAAVGANGGWSFVVAPALPLGQYTVTASQSDDVENVGSAAPRTFTVDIELPTIGLTAPANGSVTRDSTPSFSGTADQPAVTVSVYAGTETTGTPLQTFAPTVGSGTWSAGPASALADGTYSVAARATNLKGTVTANAVFHVDTVGPSFTSVPDDQTLEQITAAGTPFPYAVTADDALDPSPDVDCAPAPGSTFPRGTTVVECTATDWAGHTAEETFTVTVANTIAPATVSNFSAKGENGRVRLRWSSPSDWDFARVVVSRAAHGKSNWRRVFRSSTARSYVDRDVTNDRLYDYRAVSFDIAGNRSPLVIRTARPSAFLVPAWEAEVSGPPVLRWAAKPTARYYNVQLWRGKRKILSRWPTRARYALPSTWGFKGRRYTLEPGTYFAYAWPGIGPKSAGRYGKLIGSTKFVVR